MWPEWGFLGKIQKLDKICEKPGKNWEGDEIWWEMGFGGRRDLAGDKMIFLQMPFEGNFCIFTTFWYKKLNSGF